jgi:hypothetical protein
MCSCAAYGIGRELTHSDGWLQAKVIRSNRAGCGTPYQNLRFRPEPLRSHNDVQGPLAVIRTSSVDSRPQHVGNFAQLAPVKAGPMDGETGTLALPVDSHVVSTSVGEPSY